MPEACGGTWSSIPCSAFTARKTACHLPDGSSFEKLVSQQATEYLLAMGVSPELFAIMSQVPHDEIRGLTREEARRLMLVNE